MLRGEDIALVSTPCELKPTFACLVWTQPSPAERPALPGRCTRPSCTETPKPHIYTGVHHLVPAPAGHPDAASPLRGD